MCPVISQYVVKYADTVTVVEKKKEFSPQGGICDVVIAAQRN
jgi:hypothetical protein